MAEIDLCFLVGEKARLRLGTFLQGTRPALLKEGREVDAPRWAYLIRSYTLLWCYHKLIYTMRVWWEYSCVLGVRYGARERQIGRVS